MCPCSGNQPHQDPPFHHQTKPGFCTQLANPFLPPWQLHGIVRLLLAEQPGVLGEVGHTGTQLSPRDTPPLLPW